MCMFGSVVFIDSQLDMTYKEEYSIDMQFAARIYIVKPGGNWGESDIGLLRIIKTRRTITKKTWIY